MGGHVRGREVGVLLHHLDCLPPAEFLHHHEGRATLDVPACPRVAQIMPVEILKADAFARPVEHPGIVPEHSTRLVVGRSAPGEGPGTPMRDA